MLAERHAQANIFNYSSMLDEKEMEKNNIEVCQCGCKKGEGEKLPICMNEENLSFLGPGVLLFFFYLKCLRISISLFAIGYGSFALLSNLFSPNTIDFTACEQADI